MKKTVVIGATPNTDRYSYKATVSLERHGHQVVPLGIRKGEINGRPIINERPIIEDVDTVTLYINPERQKDWYDYILSLHPKRIIFNPGTENDELVRSAKANGILPLEACTLVLLSTNQY